ncbi:MAG TPA: Crp/Fnr family transcriptional regulator [Pyrinomonadaceae bacterium]|nr:Crp/Fnr family transcriptional regulator [Pyrinomonadaceae bacterium]
MKEMLSNKILNRLTDSEFARLMPALEPVSLIAGDRLAETGEPARFVYFPENSIISCHADMRDGKSAEVGMVGKDGVAGLPAPFSSGLVVHSLTVAISGSALRMSRAALERELDRSNGLHQILLPYVSEYVTQVGQRAACAILHRMEQRFAVWLLMITDRLDGAAVGTTQERIAQHLGVRRAGITVVARELQSIGAISYRRGQLHVVDRELLEKVACECYGTLALPRSKPVTGDQAHRAFYATATSATKVDATNSIWKSHSHRAPTR